MAKNSKSLVNDENYFNIQGWMISKLKLKGNELLVYAIVYSFSKTENRSFTGSLQYLAGWSNSTKQCVLKSLKSLCEKQLLLKSEININGVKYCEYRANLFNEALNKVAYPIKESLTEGIKQSLPNNTDNNNKENSKDIFISAEAEKQTKHRYGIYKNVLLTDNDIENLKEKFPYDYMQKIERLSDGIELKGYKYKNHYLAILKWAEKETEKAEKERSYAGYDIKLYEKMLAEQD